MLGNAYTSAQSDASRYLAPREWVSWLILSLRFLALILALLLSFFDRSQALEHGIRPDMLNGTSAGAINAVFLAVDPTPGSALDLGEMWKRVDTRQVLQGSRLTMLWRFLTGNDNLSGPRATLRR